MFGSPTHHGRSEPTRASGTTQLSSGRRHSELRSPGNRDGCGAWFGPKRLAHGLAAIFHPDSARIGGAMALTFVGFGFVTAKHLQA